ncbi:MAG: MerR family transcriptional regulator [Lachnospiraceae bacterium]|nr:MerR family transcriptional regulator [Lachnospiraceae bacterium]
MDKQRYMISDAANLVNVESHVLRYWEEELELTIPRNEMGHRYYTKENIDQFFQIKEWKEQGYQLKAIKMLIHNGGKSAEQNYPSQAAVVKTSHAEPSYRGESYQDMVSRVAASAEPFQDKVSHPEMNAVAAPENCKREMAVSSVEDNTRRLEQFQRMMTEIVKESIRENNQELGKEVSQQVRDYVLKEMNYLMREQDEAEEERYKKLDELIRQSMKVHVKKEKKLFRKKAELKPT